MSVLTSTAKCIPSSGTPSSPSRPSGCIDGYADRPLRLDERIAEVHPILSPFTSPSPWSGPGPAAHPRTRRGSARTPRPPLGHVEEEPDEREEPDEGLRAVVRPPGLAPVGPPSSLPRPSSTEGSMSSSPLPTSAPLYLRQSLSPGPRHPGHARRRGPAQLGRGPRGEAAPALTAGPLPVPGREENCARLFRG
jgi:hypothetical protein